MTTLIDYDAGNIKSVEKAIAYLGEEAVLTADRDTILASDRCILPGVGNFGDAMKRLTDAGLDETIRAFAATGKPFLGICLGLQLLFTDSEESPGVKGLGLLPGHIVKFPEAEGLKVPQIGWNNLKLRKDVPIFRGLPEDPYVYFVHSYYLAADREEDVAATCEYGINFHAAVASDNIYACQFHPEKSSSTGLAILKNFLSIS